MAGVLTNQHGTQYVDTALRLDGKVGLCVDSLGGGGVGDVVKIRDGVLDVKVSVALDSTKNAIFVQSESLASEITLNGVKLQIDKFTFNGANDLKVTLDGETVGVSNWPADFPDAGTHTRLDALNLKDFATQTTLALVKGVLDTIKIVLDNIFVRQANGTQRTKLTDGANDVTVTNNRLDVNATMSGGGGFFQLPPRSFQQTYTGQQTNTNLITPATGKRIHAYGVLIDSNTVAVISVKANFVSGAGVLIWQCFMEKQKGPSNWMPINKLGGVNESVVLNTTGISNSTSVFVSIAYDEV